MNKLLSGIVVLGLAGSSVFASGFQCEGGDGYNVKLYNKLVNGTRVPAALIVSHLDSDPATQLVAKGSAIHKTNRPNTVRYTVDGAQMDLDQVILQIRFLEGKETLEKGETVEGQLILVAQDGSKDVVSLECARYLKGE